MAAQSKHVFSKIVTVTDIKKRLAVPSAIQRSLPPFSGGHTVTFQFYTVQDPVQFATQSAGRGTRNPYLYIGQGEDGSSYYRVKVGREIHFFGIPQGVQMQWGGNGTGDHEHAAAEAYPQIITRSHQGLLRQPTTPYGAELDLTLALGPPNVEGNTMIGSMARL